MKLRVLDLFSGIGGFSLGLERTGGFETVAFCEIDPFCRKVLAKHWPEVPCAEDITKREFIEGEADVIVGGFPCQDLSAMGKRAGLSGERSGLYRELVRALRVVGPRHAIVENVADLLSDGMDVVLGDMASIGYDAEWHCIPAQTVGAPHERDRAWIIADAQDESRVHEPYAGQIAERLSDYDSPWQASPWDEAAPRVCRMDDGVPDRVDRTSACGNAVVHQIPELIGNAILADRQRSENRIHE